MVRFGLKNSLLIASLLVLGSCVQTNNSRSTDTEGVLNNKNTVEFGHGRILEDNPIILSGNASLSEDFNIGLLLKSNQVAITDKTQLIYDCDNIPGCMQVSKDQSIEPFDNPESKWGFGVYSSEFLQVNAYGHSAKFIDKFQANLIDHHLNARTNISPSNASSFYATSLPQELYRSLGNWHPTETTMRIHADCSLLGNAFFDSSTFRMCLGSDQVFKDRVKFAQDNTVVYHELGHAYTNIAMNMRNTILRYDYANDADPNTNFEQRSGLGYLSYDEAKSVNEGIADYISYYINGRSHVGEWALGRFNRQSRPLKEDDPLHASGIDTDSSSRLSYPTYVAYDPNQTTIQKEDVHYAGQIIGHYLVALTESFQTYCAISNDQSRELVSKIMIETLAELGDLTSTGNDHVTGYTVNMNPTLAQQWLRAENPITYRKFAQYMAKYIDRMVVVNKTGYCPTGLYTRSLIETLLDDYGLLLFRSYNEDGAGGSIPGITGVTSVDILNRKKSELISKDLLDLESRNEFSAFTIFDDRNTLLPIAESLSASGLTTGLSNQLSSAETNLQYNNGNGLVSPGEFVGIYVNLFNDSNSVIGGPRVLATDWAHMKNDKPCSNLSDGFPTVSQGGETCDTITSTNFNDDSRYHPVCMLEYNDGSTTQILSQKTFLEKMKTDTGFMDQDCLHPDDTKACFIRFVPGADVSMFSKLDPKKNWLETIKDSNGNPKFTTGNILFMEVNKNIPMGTKVTCRLRSTFTNCDECYHDANDANRDDYDDWEYATEKPFNIINLNFQVRE